jgi:hypothetical protein
MSKDIESYMRRDHIPEIGATECFLRIRFDRASDTRFRTCYHAETEADLKRYLALHADGLRKKFSRRFPSGVTVSRETWVEREAWE